MRDTKQRAAIRDTFKNAGNRLLSPKEVLELASKVTVVEGEKTAAALTKTGIAAATFNDGNVVVGKVPNLGIATVYRNIKTMVALGELQAVMLPGQPDRYTLAGTDVGVIMMTKDGQVTHTTGITSSCEVSLFSKHTYFIEK